MNDGMYVCFIYLCPADELEDWYVNRGRAMTVTAIVASLSEKLTFNSPGYEVPSN